MNNTGIEEKKEKQKKNIANTAHRLAGWIKPKPKPEICPITGETILVQSPLCPHCGQNHHDE